MKKLLKIVAVVVLVVGAAIAVPMLIDGDDVKAAVAEQVKRHTGRDLRIPGEVEISVFPWLGAKLGALEFGNAAGFSADVFARTEQVDVRVKLKNLSFQFLDGALNGVNIAQMIRDAKATITGGAESGDPGPKKTDFAEISGTAKVTDGTISNRDLKAKSPLLRLSGEGTAALPTQALNYRATVTLVASSKGH